MMMHLAVAAVFIAVLGPGTPNQETAPLSDPEQVFWSHAPFEMGECGICHVGNDPAAPGALNAEVNDLCLGCHEIFADMLAEYANVHSPVEMSCTNCHNPHNSRREKLLNVDTVELCNGCHEDIVSVATNSPVRHDPVTNGRACLTCHDVHASNVEAMLTGLPFDLCIECHSTDEMTDDSGRPMTNLKSLLAESHMHHGPVGNKDCSACHATHGGQNFRMLVSDYPAKFYAAYDKDNYELCFGCHETDVFDSADNAKLTGFRDGDRNLHYLHVNKTRRGRTCRACHEVHAAPQTHMIRDGVPYGASNWELKINYTGTENGGSCAKTCHQTKPYSRRGR